ncbi:phosphotransferase family protein [Virgibacillus kekensis]|uniref:Phosphotransferase family protein n=1 Tax=Virgibacillus kekensis TaxID=202261 RepID=A0ABV9DMY5_9BACI
MEKNTGGLPEKVLDWVLRQFSPTAAFDSAAQLKGSTSSTLFRISLWVENSTENYVIRLLDNQEWLEEEPDLAIHEAASLQVAEDAPVPTPEVIAIDETGIECGIPAVLMTMQDGAVDLKPSDMESWLNQLAESLVKIHQEAGDNMPYDYFPYNDPNTIEFPSWSRVPEYWKRAIKIVAGSRPPVKECFIHRDYHPANVLWKNGRVSGIVDWVNACKGPAGVDVAHCRWNLAILYGVDAANGFLQAYQRYASDFLYDPYWDLRTLIDILGGPPEVYAGWADFGVTGLTDDMMEERLDKYVVSLLE